MSGAARRRARRGGCALLALVAAAWLVVDPADPLWVSERGKRFGTRAGQLLAAAGLGEEPDAVPTGPRFGVPGARTAPELRELLGVPGGDAVAFDNGGDPHGPRYRFDHALFDAAPQAQLRERYGLAEVAAEGGLAGVLALCTWTRARWDYGVPSTEPHTANAARLLEAAARGERFFCAHYAYVFAQCAVSLGLGARVVRLEDPSGRIHAGAEAWVDELGGWVYLDPTHDRHYERPGTPGLPLSALEVQAACRERADLIDVRGDGTRRPADPGDLALFWRLRVCYRDDFLARGYPLWHPRYFGNLWQGLWREHRAEDDWTLNQVRLSLRVVSPRVLDVDLETYTPNFVRLEARIDEGPWLTAPPRVTWRLHPGTNRLEARSLNAAGLRGRSSKLRVDLP